MKRVGLLFCLLAVLLLASCASAVPAEGPALEETEGRLLLAADGAAVLVTADGEPMVLSVQAEGDDPWSGFHSGDRISVTHDGVDDSYPMRTGAYDWKLLGEGTLEDVPEETLTALEELGWDFGREPPDIHAPAAEPQTVDNPVTGYCGNTVTTVKLDGEEFSFWGDDSVALTDIVINLAYDPERICRCLPEFTVDTEFGDGYGVNLTESYARCDKGQASLTAEQTKTIREIVERQRERLTDMPRAVSLPPEAETEITGILRSGAWEAGTADCLSDYTLEIGGRTLAYHSSCGTFNDNGEGRHLSLAEDQRQRVNGLLGLAEPPAPGPGRPAAAWIGDDVTRIEVVHTLMGQDTCWTAEGEAVDALREWASDLRYRVYQYREGESPGDMAGGEAYRLILTEGDYPGFSYVKNGADGCYLHIEGQWYSVSNPSDPPATEP